MSTASNNPELCDHPEILASGTCRDCGADPIARQVLSLDRQLRFLLGGHAAVLSPVTLDALAQLEATIRKVSEEAGR